MTSESDLIDWRDRVYISTNVSQVLGIVVQGPEGPMDPDGEEVTAAWYRQGLGGSEELVDEPEVTRRSLGTYDVNITGVSSQVPGNYRLDFTYEVDGVEDVYNIYAIVGQANPYYDNLNPEFKELVESVWYKFADAFDSPNGGPHLQTYFQSHWSRGRVAQLMAHSIAVINNLGQPVMNWTIDGVRGQHFPVQEWGGLLTVMTLIECYKHLMRSYVEQPMLIQGNSITRHDRRDYLDRWRVMLDIEKEEAQLLIDTFKLSKISFSRPGILVAGGVFGRYAPTRVAGNMAARPRHYYRFYT